MKEIICPNCYNLCYILIDEWGRTPWHLHCNNCNINIGIDKLSRIEDIFQKHHKPNTYIEYYEDKIQLEMEIKE